jgi:hypothetical protein
VLRLRLRGLSEWESSLWSSFLMSHGRLLIVDAELEFLLFCVKIAEVWCDFVVSAVFERAGGVPRPIRRLRASNSFE